MDLVGSGRAGERLGTSSATRSATAAGAGRLAGATPDGAELVVEDTAWASRPSTSAAPSALPLRPRRSARRRHGLGLAIVKHSLARHRPASTSKASPGGLRFLVDSAAAPVPVSCSTANRNSISRTTSMPASSRARRALSSIPPHEPGSSALLSSGGRASDVVSSPRNRSSRARLQEHAVTAIWLGH